MLNVCNDDMAACDMMKGGLIMPNKMLRLDTGKIIGRGDLSTYSLASQWVREKIRPSEPHILIVWKQEPRLE